MVILIDIVYHLGISGSNFTSQVTIVENGSSNALFIDPIPLYMTEIPIEWALGREYGSTVEIYQVMSLRSIVVVASRILTPRCELFRM